MRYVLGFDGGGTKTDCVLMDEAGAILASARSGPSNPSRVGLDAAVSALIEAADKALMIAGPSALEVVSVRAGIAGVGATGTIPTLAQKLKLTFPNATVLINTDLAMALAATQEIPSIVVIAGTGSAVIGRDSSGNLAREGGLGPILGDPGSAYDIGRKAVVLGLRHSIAGEDSNLGKEILNAFECNWIDLQHQIRSNADGILPKIFPIVTNAANQGDTSARALLQTAADELAELVSLVVQRLGLQHEFFFLAKTGGVFYRSPFLDDHFDASVRQIARNSRIGPLPQPISEFAARTALVSLKTPVKNVGV